MSLPDDDKDAYTLHWPQFRLERLQIFRELDETKQSEIVRVD